MEEKNLKLNIAGEILQIVIIVALLFLFLGGEILKRSAENEMREDTVEKIEQDGEDIFNYCNDRGCFLSKVQLEHILEKYYDSDLVYEALSRAEYSSWAE